MNQRRAFTLIELLVVIAIIAILAAILFPVFAQAKDAAKKSVGLSNVKQLSLGYLLYLNDNNDTFPFSVTERYSPTYNVTGQDTAANAALYSARELLSPYIKSDGLWKDPSATQWPTPAQTEWWSVDYGTNFNEGNIVNLEIAAGYNAAKIEKDAPFYLAYEAQSTSGNPAGTFTGTGVTVGGELIPGLSDFGINDQVTDTSIAQTSNFILIADAARLSNLTWSASRGGLYPQPWAFDDSAPSWTGSLQSRPYPHHGDASLSAGAETVALGGDVSGGTYVQGGINIGFADGHAKWQNVNQTWTSYDNNEWRRNPSTP